MALMTEPAARHWGYELSREAGVRSGVLYPILHRMHDNDWLSDGWEASDQSRGRPPRRYYELTELGLRELGGLLQEARSDVRFARLIGAYA
jgi:PadR family transcriptional regulator PadR